MYEKDLNLVIKLHTRAYTLVYIQKHMAQNCDTLPHAVKHYKKVQYTATHCNTLQHTATHCTILQ